MENAKKNLLNCKAFMLRAKEPLSPDQKCEMLTTGEWGLGYGFQNGSHKHLYLASEREIQIGDYAYNMLSGNVLKVLALDKDGDFQVFILDENKEWTIFKNGNATLKKIEASTDAARMNSIEFGPMTNVMPGISETFLREYANSQSSVINVKIELGRLNPDNTIIIHANLRREEGYYWVKTQNGEWHVARWNKDLIKFHWTVCWHKFSVEDEEFLEIDENKIQRKQYSECPTCGAERTYGEFGLNRCCVDAGD